jgi:streptomycin 6-kinase
MLVGYAYPRSALLARLPVFLFTPSTRDLKKRRYVMFTLPAEFVRIQTEIGLYDGRAWLDRLPAILDACAQSWGLTLDPPFPHLSYHYAAPAIGAGGLPVVVKACAPSGEFHKEAAALRVYDGQGAARLLAADHEREVLLLERVEPGTLLLAMEDDEEATSIAAGVMRALWRPAPPDHPFPTVADWGEGFVRLRRRYDGGASPFPPALLEEAERLFTALNATAAAPVVLHGDLHHYNILAAGARGWLAIDPKGLVGEPAYETGAFLRNRLPEPLPNPEAARLLARRVDQFTHELGVDRARVRGWGVAQAVLAAWWSLEDGGHIWDGGLRCAELLAALEE